MVNQNFGDVQFNVQGNRIKGVKSLICSQNESLNRIISDQLAPSVIDISPDVSALSFNSLLSYYGYGMVKIDDENVIDMIVICVSYSEINLLDVCIKYLHDHFKFKLAYKLFANLKVLNSKYLIETKQLIQSYIPIFGSYLLSSDIIYQFEPQIIEEILRTNNLITENEEFLLNRLICYYNENNNNNNNNNCNNNNEMQELLPKLLLQIKWNEIPKEKINPDLLSLPYFNEIVTTSTQQIHHRIYFKLPVTSNELLNEIIMKCCYGLYVKDIHLSDELNMKIKSVNINDYLRELFECNNIKLEIIIILLIHEYLLSVNLGIYYNRVMNDIINFYKYNCSNEREKVFCEAAVKCLSYFVLNIEDITKIATCCGDNIIYIMLNINYNLSHTSKSKLVEYLCNIKFNTNKMDEIRQNISDSEIVQYVENYNHFSTSSLRDSLIPDNYSFDIDECKKCKRGYRHNDNDNRYMDQFNEAKRYKKNELEGYLYK